MLADANNFITKTICSYDSPHQLHAKLLRAMLDTYAFTPLLFLLIFTRVVRSGFLIA
jgi:hypothetical protein